MQTEILLITEARSSDTKSFYKCNTPLYRSVKRAFEMQFGNFKTDIDFLAFFEEIKCKIEYLVTEEIDRRDVTIRNKQRSEGVDSLAKRLRTYRPKYIIIIMKDIEKFVLMAVERANLPEDLFIKSVPFPAMSEKNRINCELKIAEIIKDYVSGH